MDTAFTEVARLVLRESAVMLSLPELCLQLRRILDDPDHSRKDVANVMRFDPALTARLLRIVNSPYYGLPHRVSSISQALGILGENELHNLVLVTSLMNLSKSLDTRMDIARFWKSSVYTAVLARNLSHADLPATREENFIAGLLLNIGKLPLYCKEPTLLTAIDQEMADRGCDELDAERSLAGTDHACVGAVLAESWNFPAQLVELIASHHRPRAGSDNSALPLLQLAGYFGDWHERHQGQQLTPGSRDLLDCPWSLSVPGIEVADFWDKLKASYDEHLEIFDLFCGDLH